MLFFLGLSRNALPHQPRIFRAGLQALEFLMLKISTSKFHQKLAPFLTSKPRS